MAYTRIVYDMENNAEVFHQALRETPVPEEFAPILEGLDSSLAVGVYVEPGLAARFEEWVSRLPGYEDGPEHARTALLFYENQEMDDYDEEGDPKYPVVE